MSHPKTTAEQKRAMPWLMLHAEYLDNYEFGSCSWQAQGIYWKFYLYAWSQDGTGEIYNKNGLLEHDLGKVAYGLHTESKTLQSAFDELTAAGFLEKHGNYYRLARYAEEQVNQAEHRKNARERQAKRRSGSKESEMQSDSDNESDSYSNKEKVTIPSVTHESRVTNDGLIDGNENSFSHSAMPEHANQNNKPKPTDRYDFEIYSDDVHELVSYCKNVARIEVTNALAAKFDDLLLYPHVTKPMIKEIIDRLATREDVHTPIAYLFESLKELEPQPCTKNGVEVALVRLYNERRENDVQDNEPIYLDDISRILVKMGYQEPEYSDYQKWGFVANQPAGLERTGDD